MQAKVESNVIVQTQCNAFRILKCGPKGKRVCSIFFYYTYETASFRLEVGKTPEIRNLDFSRAEYSTVGFIIWTLSPETRNYNNKNRIDLQ